MREQEEAKREHEEREKERKDECEANDQPYERDEGNWSEIYTKPFSTQKVQYVVCLNTLGQDREFTPEQIQYALDTVKLYQDEWERIEKANLRKDIDRKLDNMDAEKAYKDHYEAMDIQEAERRAEEAFALMEGAELMDDNQRQAVLKKYRWDSLTKMFYDPEGAARHKKSQERVGGRISNRSINDGKHTPDTSEIQEAGDRYQPLIPEYWKQPFLDMKDLHVFKMPRVLQTLFYLLQFEREEIAEHETNKLDFKKAQSLIGDSLFQRMSEYNPLGQRDNQPKAYQKLSFLKRMVDSVEEDKVDEYSVILGRIYRWVSQALELRIEDVRSRRDQIAFLKHERE